MKNRELQDSLKLLNRAYFNVFSTPDGELIMDDLQRHYDGTLLKKADGVVDVHASIAAIGSHKVVKHIEDRKQNGQLAR